MLAKVFTNALCGIESELVEVEVQVSAGKPRFIIIGLGDSAVRESRDRVLSAINLSGFHFPDQILINLAPAELPKEGSGFDLAIAVGILAAAGQVRFSKLRRCTIHGELSLDGRIKPIRGVVAAVVGAKQRGMQEVIVPRENYVEAKLISGLSVRGVSSLAELVAYLNKEGLEKNDLPAPEVRINSERRPLGKGFSDVWGQESAKRALLIAAAGGHNVLMIGPPGCGKTMLAQRYCTILPETTAEERLEAVKIHSIAGLPIEELLCGCRPFRSPHHVISDAGLIGGGSVPRPGEISLAHTGVLFLDEFPEYRRTAIEALRAPLEGGKVTITRARASYQFPAKFQLLAAMNPCPCGRLGTTDTGCVCSAGAIQSYLRKLSQPILDRIDLHCELQSVPITRMSFARSAGGEDKAGNPQDLVRTARERQLARSGLLNARLDPAQLSKLHRLTTPASKLLEQAAAKLNLSARAYTRIIKVAATICDLNGEEAIGEPEIAEAVSFRTLERLSSYFPAGASPHLDPSCVKSSRWF